MLHGGRLLSATRDIARGFAARRGERQLRRQLDPADIATLKADGLHLAAIPEAYGGYWQNPRVSQRVQCKAIRFLAQGDPLLALVSSLHPEMMALWREPHPPSTGAAEWEARRSRRRGGARCSGRLSMAPGGEPLPPNPAAAVISRKRKLGRSRWTTSI